MTKAESHSQTWCVDAVWKSFFFVKEINI